MAWLDRIAGAGVLAVDGTVEADAHGLAGGEVGVHGFGHALGDGVWKGTYLVSDELKGGDEEAAGGAVFDEEGLISKLGE
jgi:hypothetical protein